MVPDDQDGEAGEMPLHAMGPDAVTCVVQQHLHAITGWSSLDSADSFFDRGIDSLQGLQLTRALRRSFYRPDFALSTVYQNSTIPKLVAAILSMNGNEHNERKTIENLLVTYRELIQKMPIPKDLSSRASGPVNVLLTGSTGTVGTYLLHAQLYREGVGHIFCLNRGEDGGRAAHLKSFAVAGLETTGLDNGEHIAFIKADLQQPLLGLDSPTYDLLGAQLGLVIHAAWPVNFNLALSAIRPQLAGLVNLLALAASASAQFVFISSIAAVEGYAKGSAPEEVLHNLDYPAAFGYGRAKFLAELLVDAAAQHLEVVCPRPSSASVKLLVPCNAAGCGIPRSGSLGSLVLSSLHLGQVPDSLGSRFDNVDFVPADLLADVLVDLATTLRVEETANRTTVFNVRNPRPTPWRALLPAITAAVEAHHIALREVPSATWLVNLRASSDAGDGEAATRNPAVKLLDFFEGLWAGETTESAGGPRDPPRPMAVERALATSPTLRRLEPVRLEWTHKWVEEWIAMRAAAR